MIDIAFVTSSILAFMMILRVSAQPSEIRQPVNAGNYVYLISEYDKPDNRSRQDFNSTSYPTLELTDAFDTSASRPTISHEITTKKTDNKSNKPKSVNKPNNNHHQSKKSNKLTFFKNQPKLSLTSLLAKPKEIPKQVKSHPSSTPKIIENHELFNINSPASFIDPYLIKGFPAQHMAPRTPPNQSIIHHNNQHLMISPIGQQPHISSHQFLDHQARNFMHHLTPMTPPHHIGRPALGLPQQMFDQNVAQSMEHYQKIRYSKQPDNLPILIASTHNSNTLNPQNNINVSNATNSLMQALAASTAKNLLNQLTKQNKQSNTPVVRANRDIVQQQVHHQANSQLPVQAPAGLMQLGSSSQNVNASSGTELANLIKSAADSWAVNNAAVSTADNTPTIIVEHDGPTITTVDFNNPMNQPFVDPSNGPEEDEEVSSFYNQEETEEGGSHEDRRFLRPRQPPHVQSMRHSSFDQSATSQADFFGDHRPDRIPSRVYSHGAPRGEYTPSHKRTQSSNRYPDSINAIKELNIPQEEDSGSSDMTNPRPGISSDHHERNKEANQIDKLIRELQELNKKKEAKDGRQSAASEDYEGFLGYDENNKDADDDDSDERIRQLRNKLLERLKAKHERKKARLNDQTNGGAASASSPLNGSIKIPLHALLLAALDRRMSPSEKSQTVAQADIGIVMDDRNKEVISSAHQDFNDATSDVGSLLNADSLFDAFSVTQQLRNNNSHQPVDTSILFDDSQNRPQSDAEEPQAYTSATTRSPSTPTTSSTTTTLTPLTSTTTSSTTLVPSRVPSEAAVSYGKERRSAPSDPESDFDVNRLADQYNDDKYDRSLEPSWMREQPSRAGSSAKLRRPSVEFDDEFDAMDQRTRRRMTRKRRPQPTRVPKYDETQYEKNVDNFFDKIQRDTSPESTDQVDASISSIERPPAAKRRPKKRRFRTRQRNSREDVDDVDDRLMDDKEEREYDEHDDDKETHRQPLLDEEQHDLRPRQSTWRPSQIDDEVQKIEMEARAKRQNRRPSPSDDSDADDDDQSQQSTGGSEGSGAESRLHEITTILPSLSFPEPSTTLV